MSDWWHQMAFVLVIAANSLLTSLPSFAAGCDLTEAKSIREVSDILSRRAVEAVERASRSGYRSDNRLSQLIEPSALFDLGSGDVGGPLGSGVEGARSLATTMHANTYRFLDWNYIPYRTDGCGTQKTSVEFIDSSKKELSTVEFTFREGRIVSGKGWARSYQSGLLNPVEDRK
jgi:hypothetical protein